MAIRKIPKNYLFVTGRFSGRKNTHTNEFESPLEKDYMVLLEFDESVESFEAQPLRIPVPGVKQGYVPDLLVRHKPVGSSNNALPPSLVEIKHTRDLRKNCAKYAPKFEAAHKYAAEHNYIFRVVTDAEIRTPKLSNLKFLRAFRNIVPDEGDLNHLMNLVGSVRGPISVKELLDRLAHTDDLRLHWMPIIWHAIVEKMLRCDLNYPLSNESIVFL